MVSTQLAAVASITAPTGIELQTQNLVSKLPLTESLSSYLPKIAMTENLFAYSRYSKYDRKGLENRRHTCFDYVHGGSFILNLCSWRLWCRYVLM